MRQLFSHRDDASMSTFRRMSIGMEALQFIFFIQGSDPSTRIWTFLKAEMLSFKCTLDSGSVILVLVVT